MFYHDDKNRLRWQPDNSWLTECNRATGVWKQLRESLTEVKLSRIHDYMVSRPAFGVISGFLTDDVTPTSDPDVGNVDDRSFDRQLKRSQALARLARESGFGFIWLLGYWRVEKGVDAGKIKNEHSLLIYSKVDEEKKLRKFLDEMAEKFQQTAYLFKPEGEGEQVLSVSGNESFPLGKFHPDRIATLFSRIKYGKHRNRPFELGQKPHVDGDLPTSFEPENEDRAFVPCGMGEAFHRELKKRHFAKK